MPALNCCMEVIINSVAQKVMPVAQKVLAELGYELVDVEYKTLYGEQHLIIYINSERGVGLDDCEAVSNALEAPLDALDPTNSQPYCLDVSSPGLDRPFKTPRDYERNYGKRVEVKLYAPLDGMADKTVAGELVQLKDDIVTIKMQDSAIDIPLNKISVTRLYIEFE